MPYIAELIAKGLQKRKEEKVQSPLDIIACENMIGGSEFLEEKVSDYLSESDKLYLSKFIGFPNAAVDRIVPAQKHKDVLYVEVEPFSEWVIDASHLKKIKESNLKEFIIQLTSNHLLSVNFFFCKLRTCCSCLF